MSSRPSLSLSLSPLGASQASVTSSQGLFKGRIEPLTPMSIEDCRLLDLPDELLIKVVRHATGNFGNYEVIGDLRPFESIQPLSRERRARSRLPTKRALASTNSKLRCLVLPALYEDIWVHHGAEALLQALQRGYGKFVKRIFIPHSPYAVKDEIFKKIVDNCPELKALTRLPLTKKANLDWQTLSLDTVSFDAEALNHLTRLDWNNVPNDDMHTSDYAPSFIWSLPSLRVLTLGSHNFKDFEELRGGNDASLEIARTEIKIDLPNVHTLRLRTLDALGDPFSHWYSAKLPSLRRVVLEAPAGLYPFYEGCLTFYGSRIEVIEFTAHTGFLRIDGIGLTLFYCPNVTELFFPVFNTMPPRRNSMEQSDTERMYYKVKRIVMHAFIETEAGYQVSKSWMASHFADHVESLCGKGTRFTSFKVLVLFGSEWEELIQDTFFKSLLEVVVERGIAIEYQER